MGLESATGWGLKDTALRLKSLTGSKARILGKKQLRTEPDKMPALSNGRASKLSALLVRSKLLL